MKVTYIKKILKISDIGIIFTWFATKTNIQTGRSTNFKLSDCKNLTIGPLGKQNHFNEKNIWKSEHLFKSYGWTSINIYVYIYRLFVWPFLHLSSLKNSLVMKRKLWWRVLSFCWQNCKTLFVIFSVAKCISSIPRFYKFWTDFIRETFLISAVYLV